MTDTQYRAAISFRPTGKGGRFKGQTGQRGLKPNTDCGLVKVKDMELPHALNFIANEQ